MEAFRGEQPGTEVGRRILEAAEARYRFFGYRKTTMADIAGDLGMSPANLYRFFPSKQALAAEVVHEWLQRRHAAVDRSVAAAPADTRERMHAMVLEMLEQTHRASVEQPRATELVETITANPAYRQIVLAVNQAEQAIIARILLRDPRASVRRQAVELSRQVHAALAMFRNPVFMPYYSLPELRQRARQVMELLLDGLGPHSGDPG